MISINGKYIKNIGVMKRMKPQLCFFLKKPSLVQCSKHHAFLILKQWTFEKY